MPVRGEMLTLPHSTNESVVNNSINCRNVQRKMLQTKYKVHTDKMTYAKKKQQTHLVQYESFNSCNVEGIIVIQAFNNKFIRKTNRAEHTKTCLFLYERERDNYANMFNMRNVRLNTTGS